MAAGNGAPAGGGIERDRSKLLAALEVPVTHDLLERALTHRSYAYENGGLPTNERLEFLGDAVLQLIVTDTLYREHPDHPEGTAGQAAGRRGPDAGAGRGRAGF